MTTKDDSRQSKAGVTCDTDVVSGECSPAEGAVGRRAFALLGRLMAPYRPLAVAALVTLLLDTIGTLYVPTELSALLNSAIGAQGMGPLWDHALRMLVAAVVGSGSCVASYFLAARLAADVGRDLRVSVYRKSLELSASDFERFGTGSMITRTMGDANVVQQTIVMCFVMILPVPVIAVTSVVLAWGIDPAMGQVLVAIAVAMTVVSLVAIRRSAPIFLHLQEFVDRMNVRLRETITGVRVIRAFGRERRERRHLDETFEAYAENAVRVNLIFSVADCTTFFLMNVVEVLFVWLGADRVGVHAMQIGSISALVQFAIILLFFMMMAQFAMLQVPRALACLTRATELLELEPSIKDSVREAPAPPAEELLANERESPVAEFDHVDFRFDDASEDTLHDLSFAVRRGEICAIIGNTGSGKSTIAKMLLRFHDVTGGELRVAGRDVRDRSLADLRSRMAYVPQRAWLFSGTIASNLRMAAPDATDDELWHALDTAQASFVRELPQGLEARVTQGGTNFSGGQRQRLAIARALARKADLYVFDDSFSALDYKTDAALRHALSSELGASARLIIAQRVSTIRDADQILVLKDGRQVGLGTHGQLVETCPTYQAIVESQQRGGDLRG